MSTTIKSKRRSDYKNLTKEAFVLKCMRESRKLSMRQAAMATGVSDTGINHAENGRKDLKPEFVMKLLKGYGYSYKEYMDYVTNKKETPEALMSGPISLKPKAS